MGRESKIQDSAQPNLNALGLAENPFHDAVPMQDAFLDSLVRRHAKEAIRQLGSGGVMMIATADDDDVRSRFVAACVPELESLFQLVTVSGASLHKAAGGDLLKAIPQLAQVLDSPDSEDFRALIVVTDAQDAGAALKSLIELADGKDQRVGTASLLLVLDETGLATPEFEAAVESSHKTFCQVELDRLRPEESGAYVQATLFQGGCFRNNVFPETTLNRLYQYSQGKLGLTRLLCGRALAEAVTLHENVPVSVIDIERTVADIFAADMARRPGAELIVSTTPGNVQVEALEVTGEYDITGELEVTGQFPHGLVQDDPSEVTGNFELGSIQTADESTAETTEIPIPTPAARGNTETGKSPDPQETESEVAPAPPSQPKATAERASNAGSRKAVEEKAPGATGKEAPQSAAHKRKARESDAGRPAKSSSTTSRWLMAAAVGGALVIVAVAGAILWPQGRLNMPVSVTFPVKEAPVQVQDETVAAGSSQVEAEQSNEEAPLVESRADMPGTAQQAVPGVAGSSADTSGEVTEPADNGQGPDGASDTLDQPAVLSTVITNVEPAPDRPSVSSPATFEREVAAVPEVDPLAVRIEALHEEAEALLAQNRMTLPAGTNAFEVFRRILELDSGDAKARAGIDDIYSAYARRAEEAMNDGRLDEAIRNFERALRVRPSDPRGNAGLQTARQTVQLRAAEAERSRRESALRAEGAVRQLQTGTATGDARMIQAALDNGAPANTTAADGLPLVVIAALNNDTAAVAILLEAGADARATSESQPNALVAAVQNGNTRMVELLLQAGASPDSRDELGWPVLLHAAVAGNEALVSRLLSAGGVASMADDDGRTPLMAAAWNGHAGVVDRLLDANAGTDVADGNSWTALMFAAWNGHSPVARLLVNAGANRNLLNVDGETAADLAQAAGNAALARELLR